MQFLHGLYAFVQVAQCRLNCAVSRCIGQQDRRKNSVQNASEQQVQQRRKRVPEGKNIDEDCTELKGAKSGPGTAVQPMSLGERVAQRCQTARPVKRCLVLSKHRRMRLMLKDRDMND